MRIDGVFGDLQFAGDLLGREVTVDQAQAFPLPHRQLAHTVLRLTLTHKMS